mmetsp:Transcript_12829/g.36911  ORF Transcript_12829/g.36911 Transcript_12829/m.36911 type:complete len:160 (+) Transcript_12829:902-1381(+)
MGIQGSRIRGKCGTTFYLTHSLHMACRPGVAEEPFVRSTSCMRPWMRVMLWHNNPYHLFTAWVEASISTGSPSQLDKERGGEHPMWIVTSHSPLHCRRSPGPMPPAVDRFFDAWLHELVYALRRRFCGKQAADELYKEVVSEAGVSRLASRETMPFVAP